MGAPSPAQQALIDALVKLLPQHQWRNPVMFVTWIGAFLTAVLAIVDADGFAGAISIWLWLTVLFANFAEALAEGRGKAQAAAGVRLPSEGSVFITVTDTDKPAATQLAARFHDLGFEVIATLGTAQAIEQMGVPVTRINKVGEGSPHVVDLIRERRCDLVINTPTGSGARADGQAIRTAAVRHGIPCVTTMTGASAAVRAIAAQKRGEAAVLSLQEVHGIVTASSTSADA